MEIATQLACSSCHAPLTVVSVHHNDEGVGWEIAPCPCVLEAARRHLYNIAQDYQDSICDAAQDMTDSVQDSVNNAIDDFSKEAWGDNVAATLREWKDFMGK